MAGKNFWDNCDCHRLEKLLKSEKDLSRYKRIQCVYLRVCDGLNASEIARIIGWNKGSVWNLHSSYKRNGENAFELKPKGGRYHANMSLYEERNILSHFEKDGIIGGILEVSKIKALYEERLGRKVHKTVIYRMLHRHGWRKIVPRKKHPKNDNEAIEGFKKNFHYWCQTQEK